MTILQINTTLNSGSTGRISEDIGKAVLASGNQSYIAAAYTNRPSESTVIKVGSDFDRKLHGVKSLLLDRHGFGSAQSTKGLVRKIREINPDIIHLHNIHGYYLHIGILFDFLKELKIPIVWTFHDCWPFTGHCAYFDRFDCHKWERKCYECPATQGYPRSLGIDNSSNNFMDKKRLFTGVKSLQIVTPSKWLSNNVKKSFLGNYNIRCIHNGINLDAFKIINQPESVRKKFNIPERNIILGVASVWDRRKGFDDFIRLSKIISDKEHIVLVGVRHKQIEKLPNNITGIERTENLGDLAALYSTASVFLNPTYVDNFPTTNIEALACGTPVITYDTGGSSEAIDLETGVVVTKGDIDSLYSAIQEVLAKGKINYSMACRKRAETYFNQVERFGDYLKLYQHIIKVNKQEIAL